MTARTRSRVWGALFFLGVLNFFVFFVESLRLGGDALNGYRQDGHWFLGAHGQYREVTEYVWNWSRFHAMSLFVTHPLAILAAWMAARERKRAEDEDMLRRSP